MFAFPDVAHGNVGHYFASALWASHAIGPTEIGKEIDAGIAIGKIPDCLVKVCGKGIYSFMSTEYPHQSTEYPRIRWVSESSIARESVDLSESIC
jgi:hypothetical protein